MCDLCRDRFDKNPLRILDCKNDDCIKINLKAPVIQDYLCDDCRAHQDGLMSALKSLNINYEINPRIVRGLDYYTKTVFEFVSNNIGAQGTVCGGGRYNNLVEEVGGKPCPAVGFGMGIERLIMVMEGIGLSFGEERRPDYYIAPLGDTAEFCLRLTNKLREKGIASETDISERGLKAQMKYANRIKARNLIVIGSDEMSSGKVKIKNMDSGEEKTVNIEDIDKNIEG